MRTKNHHFHHFGIWGFGDVSRPPKTILFIFGDPKTPKTNQERPGIVLKNTIFVNMEIIFWNCWSPCIVLLVECLMFYQKMWRWGSEMIKMVKSNLKKSWIWIPYLSKNNKWKAGKSYRLFYFQVREPPAPLQNFLFSSKGLIGLSIAY